MLLPLDFLHRFNDTVGANEQQQVNPTQISPWRHLHLRFPVNLQLLFAANRRRWITY